MEKRIRCGCSHPHANMPLSKQIAYNLPRIEATAVDLAEGRRLEQGAATTTKTSWLARVVSDHTDSTAHLPFPWRVSVLKEPLRLVRELLSAELEDVATLSDLIRVKAKAEGDTAALNWFISEAERRLAAGGLSRERHAFFLFAVLLSRDSRCKAETDRVILQACVLNQLARLFPTHAARILANPQAPEGLRLTASLYLTVSTQNVFRRHPRMKPVVDATSPGELIHVAAGAAATWREEAFRDSGTWRAKGFKHRDIPSNKLFSLMAIELTHSTSQSSKRTVPLDDLSDTLMDDDGLLRIANARILLEQAVKRSKLSGMQRKVIDALKNNPDLHLHGGDTILARQLGVTPTRIRQLKHEAFDKLRPEIV